MHRSFPGRAIALMAISAPLIAGARSAMAKDDTPFGTMLTPADNPNSTDAQVWQALVEADAVGGTVSYLWNWSDPGNDMSIMSQLVPLANQLGLKTFLQISPTALGSPITPPGVSGTSFSDPSVRSAYLSDVLQMADLHPSYLNLGAEINLLDYENPTEFASFATLYQAAYAEVKSVSPQTQVGVSYHMDLFFGDDEYTLPEQLGPQDFIGFTSYPAWTVEDGYYSSPSTIDPVYYNRIRSVFPTQPIVFSEVGWPSAGGSTPDEQAQFISDLPQLLSGVNPELVISALLSDTDTYQVGELTPEQISTIEGFGLDPNTLFAELNSMGLLNYDGTPKPAWDAALNLDFDEPSDMTLLDGSAGATAIPEPAEMSLALFGLMAILPRRVRRRTRTRAV